LQPEASVNRLTCLIAFALILAPPIVGQELATDATASSTASTSATNALARLNQAFSQGKPVSDVNLTGTANWIVGSTTDSGSFTLTASRTGSSSMQLSLGEGSRSESTVGSGSAMQCQWSDKNGQSHNVDAANCWKPVVWFLPAFSLQPGLIPSILGVADLGNGTVGSSEGSLHHLQSQVVLNEKSRFLVTDVTRQSTTDLGLDPTSYLPSVLAYSVMPDRGSITPVSIEIHYGDYRVVDGVQIPFSIQRYVNGSLQLDLSLTNAQID
jgi:hypothetical protein